MTEIISPVLYFDEKVHSLLITKGKPSKFPEEKEKKDNEEQYSVKVMSKTTFGRRDNCNLISIENIYERRII